MTFMKNTFSLNNYILIIITFTLTMFIFIDGIQSVLAQNLQVNELKKISSNNFKTYQNSDLGIEIEVPSSWSIEVISSDKLKFVSPLESKNDTYRESLRIQIEKINDPTYSLEKYTLDRIDEYLHPLDEYLQNSSNWHLYNIHKFNMPSNNLTAYALSFNSQDIYSPFDERVLNVLNGNTFYSIYVQSNEKKFDNYFPIFDKMINSLKFIN